MDTAAVGAVFRQTDRELWLVTAQADGRRGGLIATCVAELSIVPELPRVLVGLARQHATWELVRGSGAFALHLISAGQIDLVWRFGLQSGKNTDKLDGLTWRAGAGGSPILAAVAGWLDCRVEASLDVGDRTVFVAEVLDGGLNGSAPPLTMKHLLRECPPDKLQKLRADLAHDAGIDAPLIRAWRARAGERGA